MDWTTDQDLFQALSKAWEEDFPNIKNYYIFPIWPGTCGTSVVWKERHRQPHFSRGANLTRKSEPMKVIQHKKSLMTLMTNLWIVGLLTLCVT
jgi:hypothetical protein